MIARCKQPTGRLICRKKKKKAFRLRASDNSDKSGELGRNTHSLSRRLSVVVAIVASCRRKRRLRRFRLLGGLPLGNAFGDLMPLGLAPFPLGLRDVSEASVVNQRVDGPLCCGMI